MATHKRAARQIFGFLGLPRELRDMVYDYHELLEPRFHPDERIRFMKPGKDFEAPDHMLALKPCTSLVLLCRQIR